MSDRCRLDRTRVTKAKSDLSEDANSGSTSARAAAMLMISLALSMVVVSLRVVGTSVALFSDTTSSTGSSFSVGSVDLVDDDSAGTIFTVTNMTPGQAVTGCIVVTYQGTIADPAGVKLYSGGYTDSGDLDTFLNLTIEEGTGGSIGSCTGFSLENTIESGATLADFDSTHTNYANGAGVWDPGSTPEAKTYRITVELDGATPNAEQGESVTAMTLTWEVPS